MKNDISINSVKGTLLTTVEKDNLIKKNSEQ